MKNTRGLKMYDQLLDSIYSTETGTWTHNGLVPDITVLEGVLMELLADLGDDLITVNWFGHPESPTVTAVTF